MKFSEKSISKSRKFLEILKNSEKGELFYISKTSLGNVTTEVIVKICNNEKYAQLLTEDILVISGQASENPDKLRGWSENSREYIFNKVKKITKEENPEYFI